MGITDSLTASAVANNPRDQFEWLSLPNGDFALRAMGGGGHLVAVNSATGLLYPNADSVYRAVANFRATDTAGAADTAGRNPLPKHPRGIAGCLASGRF